MSRIRTNLITNRMANGAPTVSNGLVVSGVTTVTTLDLNGDIDVDGHTNLDNVNISGISSTGNIYITTGGNGRKLSFAGDGSSHYIKMDDTLNGPIINGYGGIAFETNGTNERLRIGSNGLLTVNATTYDALTINTTENGTNGPQVQLTHISASPAAGDYVGQLRFSGKDSAGNTDLYSRISTVIDDPTSGQETAHLQFSTRGYSSFNPILRLKNRGTASAPSYTADDINGIILDVYNTGNPYPRYMNFIAKSGGNTDSNIGFWTEAVGGSPTEKLRITSGGQVNIGTNGALKAEINNSVGGHYFVSQCDDNQNGFEIYQQHGATHTRAPFAVYDNKTGSKDLSFKIDGAGYTYHNTTSYGTTNGNVDKRYNWGSTNNLNFGMHLSTRQRYAIWEHRQGGRTNPRTAQISTGENGSNQGTVICYSSTANADVTGGVHLTNGATSWSGNSDMRLKNKTGDILNALEDINKIEPLKFTWKYGPDNNSHVGVSAQSVENVVPEAIDRGVDVERQREGDETEYMKVRYTELIPLSIAAIKELKAEVESLKAEIASLKSS